MVPGSGALSSATPAQRSQLEALSLAVLEACLGFDFIGTNPDESADDVGTVQVGWPSFYRMALLLQGGLAFTSWPSFHRVALLLQGGLSFTGWPCFYRVA